MELNLDNIKKGPGSWKLNTSILNDYTYSPVQKVITLRDLQKVFSEHWSIQQCFMLKRNNNIQNDGNKLGNYFQCS